jgi:NAD(P)H-hydrate epimerase
MGVTIPTIDGSTVPHLTADQMVEVDRAMIEEYQIDLVRMMENAGRNLASLARLRFLDGDARGRRVIVLAGSGGNGGGALVAARRLHNYGADVSVVITRPGHEFAPVPGEQLDIVRRMGLPIETGQALTELPTADLVIDGVIGYSLSGAPRGAAATLIEWANDQPAPVLSLDAPSGIDVTSGVVLDPAIRATATMTLALPKEGLRARGVDSHVGELYLADISVPSELYSTFLGIDVVPLFATSDLLRLS